MTDNETKDIKEQAYKLAWELFNKECPYIKKSMAHYANMESWLDWELKVNLDNQFELMLTKILPREIWLDASPEFCDYCYDLRISPKVNGKIEIDYWWSDKNLRGKYTAEYGNFWESVLMLLKHIDVTKDRYKMIFKWSEV